jgi:hypothetical protein
MVSITKIVNVYDFDKKALGLRKGLQSPQAPTLFMA